MRQLYMKMKPYRAKNSSSYFDPYHPYRRFYANCSILIFALLHNAELLCSGEKLFLIRSAASGLTVILPNMDRMAGGELE